MEWINIFIRNGLIVILLFYSFWLMARAIDWFANRKLNKNNSSNTQSEINKLESYVQNTGVKVDSEIQYNAVRVDREIQNKDIELEDLRKKNDKLLKENETLRNRIIMMTMEEYSLDDYDEAELIYKLKRKLIDCDISVRCLNVLRATDIVYVWQLVAVGNLKELYQYRNFGKKSYIELTEFLEKEGLRSDDVTFLLRKLEILKN